jgi:hypothetical protein
VLFAAPADAQTVPTFADGTLRINGDATRNAFVVGSTPDGLVTLNERPIVVLGAPVRLADVHLVHMDGAGAEDILRLDESNGPMPPGEFVGGEGNDTLDGGSSADSLVGGAGIDTINGNAGVDTIDGGPGNDKDTGGAGDDVVHLGADSDQFTWNAGDGSDRVDGDGGTDTLLLNGAELPGPVDGRFTETMNVTSDGTRTALFYSQALGGNGALQETLSVSGFEQVKVDLRDNLNRLFFAPAGSDISVMRVDLGPNGANPDPTFTNTAEVIGTAGPDPIRVFGTPPGEVTVAGAGVTLLVKGAGKLSVPSDR